MPVKPQAAASLWLGLGFVEVKLTFHTEPLSVPRPAALVSSRYGGLQVSEGSAPYPKPALFPSPLPPPPPYHFITFTGFLAAHVSRVVP